MSEQNVNIWTTIIGPAIGFAGFVYGFIKDLKLRRIETRANAPHFVFRSMLIDMTGASKLEGKQWEYSYHTEPPALGDKLFKKEYGADCIPDNYPDEYPAGIMIKNEGDRIRYYSVNSQQILLKEFDNENDIYAIYYIYTRKNVGLKIEFDFNFESEKGIHGKQTWCVSVGENIIYRIKPKIPKNAFNGS